jgi:hypothetical protein
MTCGFEFRVSSPAITSPEIYDDFDRYIRLFNETFKFK